MSYDPHIHHRRSIRLIDYDYSQAGAYFVTIVTHNRIKIFGEIHAGEMTLSPAGELACQVLLELPDHYPTVEIDEFIFMPNHLHAILINQPGPTRVMEKANPAIPSYSLPEIVRGFKTYSARQINSFLQTSGIPLWQRGYFDHIIRNEGDLGRVREYIRDNPRRWLEDAEYRG